MKNSQGVYNNLKNKIYSLGFWDAFGSANLIQTTRPCDSQKQQQQQQQKWCCRIVDFDLPADRRVKLRENKRKDKYPDFARERKKVW